MMLLVSLLQLVSMLVGGSSQTVGPNSPEVLQQANYAIIFHNHKNNYTYAFKVITIESADVQLYPPARVKFTMEVVAGQTACKNEPGVDPEDCTLMDSGEAQKMLCNFVVLAVPHSHVPSYVLLDRCN